MPINFLKSQYSPKAKDFLAQKPLDFPLLTLLCGSVRSGKTVNIIYKIPDYFNEIGNEYLKVFSGYSKNTVRNNVLVELIPYLENYHGAQVKFNSSSGEMDIKLWGKLYNCLVIGGGKSDSYTAIQGGTWDFWYANELPLHHYSFYNMALSRLTPQNARAVADANPESSNHWLYQERILPYKKGDADTVKVFDYRHFTLDDNWNLSETFKENQKKLYKGAFYARKILGEWVVADGLVYDTFNEEKHTCSKEVILEKIKTNEFIDYFAGIDWGWEHPTAVGIYGITKAGIYYKLDELKREHIDHTNVVKWLKDKQQEYSFYIHYINADNARPEQNIKVRDAGFMVFEDKPQSVADSIALIRQVINFDKLVICKDTCPNTLQEIRSYSYVDKNTVDLTKKNVDLDVPVKLFDDCMDEMRYALYLDLTRFHRISHWS